MIEFNHSHLKKDLEIKKDIPINIIIKLDFENFNPILKANSSNTGESIIIISILFNKVNSLIFNISMFSGILKTTRPSNSPISIIDTILKRIKTKSIFVINSILLFNPKYFFFVYPVLINNQICFSSIKF